MTTQHDHRAPYSWSWHLYNLLNTSRRPTHLPTLRDILFAHRVQRYKEPWFIDPIDCLCCLVGVANCQSFFLSALGIKHIYMQFPSYHQGGCQIDTFGVIVCHSNFNRTMLLKTCCRQCKWGFTLMKICSVTIAFLENISDLLYIIWPLLTSFLFFIFLSEGALFPRNLDPHNCISPIDIYNDLSK